jgi:hypothetical protein
MKRFIAKVSTIGVGLLIPLALPLTAGAAGNTQTVTPENMNGWAFVDDTNNTTETATGHMVTGPTTPPLGVGSAELETTSSTDGQMLMKNAYGGQKLSDLTTLTYSTYVKSGNNTLAPAVQFSVDKDVTDSNTSWQGRVVFEPYLNGTVTDNTWQNWSAVSGHWWLTKPSAFNDMCAQSSPCTLNDLVSAFPNIGVNGSVNQQILFKAGAGWSSDFVGDVDALTVQFNGSSQTTYDFEPYQSPSSTDQCKNNGYKDYRDSNGLSFKNQGQCVSWVQHNVNGNGQGNQSNQGQVQGASTNNNQSATKTGTY